MRIDDLESFGGERIIAWRSYNNETWAALYADGTESEPFPVPQAFRGRAVVDCGFSLHVVP
ncbi:hypothetical protein SAMN04244553_3572 [Nocardia amikacinitolerans]|uniref:Uncharacterized protein n=1 Tax=Nocardia amikacinitolerans TaxID=756689 RepID=A0A285LKH4_9NOCA|nr:hypothetical protein [Nocardia amikacinitolerans]SNY83861.1 hypothetical protein SAMN04244553_3572 [Nocardia amikacinitolerans]